VAGELDHGNERLPKGGIGAALPIGSFFASPPIELIDENGEA